MYIKFCLTFCPLFSVLLALHSPRLGRKSWSVCVSCVCLFCAYWFVSSLGVRYWLRHDCGTLWLFLDFTFLLSILVMFRKNSLLLKSTLLYTESLKDVFLYILTDV